uniref:Uncharacterized protein n=1 Tax=Pyramimonas orientalis virus TaxID=455367 RepID=A0A7M3UP30_POV01|nr:hypothetical protein HWQ62_00351 [Pyramimonas orientalis virus]
MRQTKFIYAIVEKHMLDILKIKEESVRYNKDKTKFIFKTYKEEPKLANVSLYSKDRIKQILKTDEWRSNLNV